MRVLLFAIDVLGWRGYGGRCRARGRPSDGVWRRSRAMQPSAFDVLDQLALLSAISEAAYPLLNARSAANRSSFFLYQDADSGFNHEFSCGFFADRDATLAKIHLDAGCVDDPSAP